MTMALSIDQNSFVKRRAIKRVDMGRWLMGKESHVICSMGDHVAPGDSQQIFWVDQFILEATSLEGKQEILICCPDIQVERSPDGPTYRLNYVKAELDRRGIDYSGLGL